ncbi:hypothetical protein D3C86_1593880 [compost metagenome]
MRAVGPFAARHIAPGAKRQEGHLAGRKPEAQRVIKVEILQFVRPDDLFGLLARRLVLAVGGRAAGHQFRADVGIEHGRQHRFPALGHLAGFGHPAHQMADQCLRHTGIDVVVRHMVTHPIGTPA